MYLFFKFIAPQVARKAEEEERLRLAREAQFAAERTADEERDRKEREKEELRRRAADKAGGEESEQWWLGYNVTRGDASGREVAKWKARLSRFEKIVRSSTAAGERENAARLAEQARSKIAQLDEMEE